MRSNVFNLALSLSIQNQINQEMSSRIHILSALGSWGIPTNVRKNSRLKEWSVKEYRANKAKCQAEMIRETNLNISTYAVLTCKLKPENEYE